jgi:osmotically inducible protein OsmC
MPTRTARTAWNGTLEQGSGQVELSSSHVGTYDVNFPKRAADDAGGTTSPEELIAAAHAACFSMALSNVLAKGGTPPTTLRTRAEVDFQPGEGITGIRLESSGDVPGLDAEGFRAAAEDAKVNCPVSKALAVPISLTVV